MPHEVKGKIWQELQEIKERSLKPFLKQFLTEDRFTGKELLDVAEQDSDFLELDRRAKQILDKTHPVEFIEFKNRNTLSFTVESGEEPYSLTGPTDHYFNTVKLYDLDELMDGISFEEAIPPILQDVVLDAFKGDIALHCKCPSYKYWGFNWLLTQGDSAIHPENRPPDVRNPQKGGDGRQRFICKHQYALLKDIIDNEQDQPISEMANGLMQQLKIGKFD
jgi:hypothetical protein